MKKLKQKEIIEYKCDNCNEIIGFPVAELEFNYGSNFDGNKFELCSDECLKKFVNDMETEKQIKNKMKETQIKKDCNEVIDRFYAITPNILLNYLDKHKGKIKEILVIRKK